MQREIYTNTAIIQVYESWQHLLFFVFKRKQQKVRSVKCFRMVH